MNLSSFLFLFIYKEWFLISNLLEIDCSQGEGGGQIVRTSLAFSALTGRAVSLFNIREGRSSSGLKAQHIACVRAVSGLSNADTEGVTKGSKSITFEPQGTSKRGIRVEIETAGSVGLVIQSLLPFLAKKGGRGVIKGGATYGKWAPPVRYVKEVLVPLVFEKEPFLKVVKQGFYPEGGGLTVFSADKTGKRVEILEKGSVEKVKGVSVASEELKGVEKRQADTARELLEEKFSVSPDIRTETVNSKAVGSGITIWVETENSIFGGDCVGEEGKPAEEVGKEAAEELFESYERGAVDLHASDQLVPFIAINGGRIRVPNVTSHCETNVWVCNQFLDNKVNIDGKEIHCEGNEL